MKIRTTLIGAALCAMVAACSSAPDTTERAEAIQKKADEIGKITTPLYVGVVTLGSAFELDVQTCPDIHQGDIPVEDMCQGTGDIQQALVVIRDTRNRVVDVLVEDRPGGGCIHVEIASLTAGYIIEVLAIVKGAPGSTPYSVGRTRYVVPAVIPAAVH
jgi:hypothetical protein